MAKGISSGINKLAHQASGKASDKKHAEQLQRQWKELRNRLDTLLMSNNVLKGTELRQKCLALDSKSFEERQAHINEHWGPLYLQKVLPLLQQLDTLEKVIATQGKV